MTERQRIAAVRWGIFGLLLGLVPVGFSFLARLLVDNPQVVANPIARGDLFLLAATLAFSGLGNMLGHVQQNQTAVLLVGGSVILNGLVAALAYALVSNSQQTHADPVSWISTVQYVLSAIMGGACVVLTVEEP